MSETLEIETGGNNRDGARPPRARTPQRDVQVEKPDPVDFTHGTADLEAEQAVRDSASQLQESNRQAADARRLAAEETRRRQAAEAQTARLIADRQKDQQTLAAESLAGAKQAQDAARLALRAARESGDIDAEISATEALSAATYRATSAAADLAQAEANAKMQPPTQQQQQSSNAGPAPSPAAQRWMDEHPRFQQDPLYQASAIGAHHDALSRGIPAGSDAYVDHIERAMQQRWGVDHGSLASVGRPAQSAQQQYQEGRDTMNQVTGGAAPSRSGNGSGGGRSNRVQTGLGDLIVTRRANGTMGVQFANADVEANFKEGAEVSRMTLAEYVHDHIRVADEIASGGNGGWEHGEGKVYR